MLSYILKRHQASVGSETEAVVSCGEQSEKAEIQRLGNQAVGRRGVIHWGEESLVVTAKEGTKPDSWAVKAKGK